MTQLFPASQKIACSLIYSEDPRDMIHAYFQIADTCNYAMQPRMDAGGVARKPALHTREGGTKAPMMTGEEMHVFLQIRLH